MKKIIYIFGIFIVLGAIAFIILNTFTGISTQPDQQITLSNTNQNFDSQDMIQLPKPITDGDISLEEALTLRRSVRSYSNDALSLKDISQLLWSAQGITNERGFRTAPSAGATFPLEMFVVANNVNGLSKGVYHYSPFENTLELIHLKDISAELVLASHSQSMISESAAVIVFGAVFKRTTDRYGERGIRYVYNEIGHASQNLHLQAAAMDLGTLVIGAYRDEEVEEILDIDPEIRVLYMMPVGRLK
jgi:SagB-type dehydrogenase family enzyme